MYGSCDSGAFDKTTIEFKVQYTVECSYIGEMYIVQPYKNCRISYRTMFGGFPPLNTVSPYCWMLVLEKYTTLQKLQDFHTEPCLGDFHPLTTVSPYCWMLILEKCTTLQKPETVQGFIQNHVWGVSTPNYSFPPKFSVSYETLLNDERVKLLDCTVILLCQTSFPLKPKTFA